MGVTYANVPLALPDPDSRVQAWFDDWLPQADNRAISEWPAAQQNFGPTPYYPGSVLPAPNYSKPQRPKISSWYVPTGAGRWSFGYFLADYKSLQTILAKIGTNTTPQELRIENPIGYTREWSICYLLPPHPVGATVTDPAGLWVLPIVDERWYWQFVTGFFTPIDNTAPNDKTWEDLMQNVAAGLSISLVVDTIPAAYLYPDRFFVSGTTWHNGGILLDAFAYSVGQRIVPVYGAIGPNTNFLGAEWQSAGWSSSIARRTANLIGQHDVGGLQAGTITPFPTGAAITPVAVLVVFRIYKNGIVIGDWKYSRYQSYITAATAGQIGGVAFTTPGGYTVTILSTALADISTGNDPAAPDNQATLDALALQIATDYYRGLWIQDSDIVGVSQWQESGFDDFVEFNLGRPDYADGMPRTRIHSQPYNQVFERMLHYDSTTWEYGERISGTLDGTLTAGGTQTITLGTCDGAKPSGTTHVTVTSIIDTTGIAGDQIEAFRFGDVWGVNGTASATGTGSAKIVTGQTSAMVLAGASGTFTLDSAFGGGTVTATVNGGICFASTDPSGNAISYQIGKMDDGTYQVLNPTRIFLAAPPGTQVNAGSNATMTIMSGTLGSENTTGSTISVFCRDGGIIASSGGYYPLYKVIVTPQNTYEKLAEGRLFSCRIPSTGEYFCTNVVGTAVSGVFNTNSGGATTGAINVVITKGRVRSGRSYLVTDIAKGGESVVGGVCLEVVDPSLEVEGTADVNINSGATGNITTVLGSTLSCYNALALQVNISTKVKAIWRSDISASPFWAIVGNG